MVAAHEFALLFDLLTLAERLGGGDANIVAVLRFGIAGAVQYLWSLGFHDVFEQRIFICHISLILP